MSVSDPRRPANPACPICHAPAPRGTRVAPFCSARCQMIDLGNWLGESYRVPGDAESPEESPPAPGNEER